MSPAALNLEGSDSSDGCTSPKRSANATEELLSKRVDRVVAKLQVRCYALFRMSHSNVVIS